MNCKTCMFWDVSRWYDPDDETVDREYQGFLGECRRYPPTAIAGRYTETKQLPITTRLDWCGEYKQGTRKCYMATKEETKEKEQ